MWHSRLKLHKKCKVGELCVWSVTFLLMPPCACMHCLSQLTGYIGTALVLKGEEKDDPSDLAVAANELISKASKRCVLPGAVAVQGKAVQRDDQAWNRM